MVSSRADEQSSVSHGCAPIGDFHIYGKAPVSHTPFCSQIRHLEAGLAVRVTRRWSTSSDCREKNEVSLSDHFWMK